MEQSNLIEHPDSTQEEVNSSSDCACNNIEEEFGEIERVRPEGPCFVRQLSLQSVEEDFADSNADDAADSEFHKFN